MRRVYITGAAGFIGFHLARHLMDEGFLVHGFDGMTEYYDVNLKRRRLALLEDLRDPEVFDFGENPDEVRASGWR